MNLHLIECRIDFSNILRSIENVFSLSCGLLFVVCARKEMRKREERAEQRERVKRKPLAKIVHVLEEEKHHDVEV